MIEIAAVLSAVLGHWADLAIILAMLFINAGVGFWQEFKADNAIALLKQRLALQGARTPRRRMEGHRGASCWCRATSCWSSSAISFPPI